MKAKTKKQNQGSQSQKRREVLPIFKTHGSLGRSILNVKNEDEVAEEAPVSIVSIVKKHKLEKVTICDDTFLSFPSIYKHLGKFTQVVFGINFHCCSDVDGKGPESLLTESRVTVLMKNSEGYKDILRIHNLIQTDNRYQYYKPRIDWATLKEHWTENLEMMLPPYDNFIHNNQLKAGKCVPSFGDIKPILTWAEMGLPFDYLLTDAIKEYSKNNKLDLLEVHPIYYYNDDDLKPYMVLRSVSNRRQFSNPDLDFCTSNQFSVESYLRKTGQ